MPMTCSYGGHVVANMECWVLFPLLQGYCGITAKLLRFCLQGVIFVSKIRFRSLRCRCSAFNRWGQAGAVCPLAVGTLGASHLSLFDKVGHKLISSCGCGQILLDCNHVGCPISPGMIAELHKRMNAGGSDTSVFNRFAAKYGSTVLAAPLHGGFDDVSWIVPMFVFLLSTLGTGFLI
jgi:hypothetical protein